MSDTQSVKNVKIRIKDQEFEVGLPDTGQFMDLIARKSIFNHDLRVSDAYDQYAAILGEMVATYNVMIPKLREQLNVESILKLSLVESKEILDTYVDVYKPFLDSYMNLVTKPKAAVVDTKNS
jgi:hypothetical protein